jgi:hypothetical protein
VSEKRLKLGVLLLVRLIALQAYLVLMLALVLDWCWCWCWCWCCLW